MAFTANDMVMDWIKALTKGSGGTVTIGYRPESGPDSARVPARWEAMISTGGQPGQDSIRIGGVGASFEEAMEKMLVTARERLVL